MKRLKTVGRLALYTLIFIISSALAGVFIANLYSLFVFFGADSVPLDIFIIENLGLTVIISGILIIVFGGLTLVARGINPLKYLDFKRISLKDSAASLMMGIGFSLFVSCLLTLVKLDTVIPDTVSEEMMEAIAANFPLILLAIGVVVPFYEEFFFRGLIFKELQRSSKLWIAVVLQGLIFGAFHLNWFQFIYTFPAGIVMGLVFLRYRSIWTSILIHLGWNTTSTLLSLPDDLPLSGFVGLLLLGAGLLFAGLYYTYNIRPKAIELEESEPIGPGEPIIEGETL
jgi:hypothetical protein